MYLLNNQDEVRAKYEMTGCWLQDFELGGQMASESAEVVKPTMTLAYDYFKKVS
jgi:hypothetical protein